MLKRGAFFDLDGTIAESIEIGLRPHNWLAETRLYPGNIEPVHIDDLPRLRELGYLGALRDRDINPIELLMIRALTNMHMPMVADHVPAYPGMVELVNEVAGAEGIQTGVVSSANQKYVDRFLESQGVKGLDIIHGGAGLIFKAKAIKAALNEIGAHPESSIYVGDEPRDISAAHKLGMMSIGVTWGAGGEVGFENVEPDFQVSTVDDLRGVLQEELGLVV